jgi:hypothetical protein
MANTGSTHAGFSYQAQLYTSQVADSQGGGRRFGGAPGGRMTIVGWGSGLVLNAGDIYSTHERRPSPTEEQISDDTNSLRSRTRAGFDVIGTEQNGARQ